MRPETIRDYGYILSLLYPPRNHNPQNIDAFFAEMVRQYRFSQVNFNPQHNGGVLANPTGDVRDITKLQVSGDGIQIYKEPIQEGSLDRFWEYAEAALRVAIEQFRIEVLIQQNVLRVLANPAGEGDARFFLGRGVCQFSNERLRPFGRPVHAIGLRWYFPPRSSEDAEFDVKIETLLRDPTLLFIENVGKFPLPIAPNNLGQISQNLQRTRNFIINEITQFLIQFNQRSEPNA